MTKTVVLDTGPLGQLTKPKANPEIVMWLSVARMQGYRIIVPEIVDFELRRNLIAERLSNSIALLDALIDDLDYLPIDTPTMRLAAEYWARSKQQGRMAADPKELNGDVILAAQAHQVDGVVATDNIGHLSLFVEASHWRDIH